MKQITDFVPRHLLNQVITPHTVMVDTRSVLIVRCRCGKETTLGARSYVRRWCSETEYRCKSCDVKTYANNPERVAKFKQSFRKTADDPVHRERCRLSSKKMWEDSEMRKRLTEAVRQDNLINPKKKVARDIARKALMAKPWFKEHMDNMRKLAQDAIRSLCGGSLEFRVKMFNNFNIQDPKIRAKLSTATRRLWTQEAYRLHMAYVRSQQSGHLSSIQLRLYELLESLDVTHHRESPETVVSWYVFDCLAIVDRRKILIEVQGDYWHSLPERIWRDKAKKTYVSRYYPEFELMYVWEHEFKDEVALIERLRRELCQPSTPTSFQP